MHLFFFLNINILVLSTLIILSSIMIKGLNKILSEKCASSESHV